MLKRQKNLSLLLLAIIGLILYVGVTVLSTYTGQDDKMEEQAVVPAITKQQASDAAAAFAKEHLRLADPAPVGTLYQSHTVRSGYIQKEKLTATYDKQFGERLPLDYYEVELQEPATGATYYIDVNYEDAAVHAWRMAKDMAAKSKTVGAGSADPVSLAERMITKLGYPPGELQLKDPKPNALGELVFESKQWRIGEAGFQLRVKVHGDTVTSFQPGFTVPESYLAWQEAQDRQSSWMTLISMGVSALMTLASLYVIIRYRKEITYSSGLLMTLAFAAIYIANNFNMIPALKTGHDELPTELVIEGQLWVINIFIGLVALSTYFFFIAGRGLWTRRGWNPWPFWRDPRFGDHVHTSMVRGYLICLFILGVQQLLFYVAMEGFDVWAISDPGDSVYNMTYPALFPLMAWAAAISEEAAYRLFGIALFLKLVRNRFLAVLLPSMIWAMSHTQYPIYPVYTRFVEVTIIGIIFGYVFLKYGFLTAMFAHAAMDSILMGMSLIYMGEPAQVLAGALYLLVPAIVGLLVSWLHRSFTRRPPSQDPPPSPDPDPGPDRLAPV
jgi:heme/copper-type cytochrome/quinol oxidase subunit 4